MSRYTFETTPVYHSSKRDDEGSLTYSAASSIQSTGESTDSSFADIMKVLDDSRDIAAYLKKNQKTEKDEKSVAESLAYSTDAESHARATGTVHTDAESRLQGADLLIDHAIGHRYDASERMTDETAVDDVLFAAAEHSDSIKRRKERKRRERRQRKDTPPRQPKDTESIGSEEDVWYAKWWMFCFPDLKNMLPKR